MTASLNHGGSRALPGKGIGIQRPSRYDANVRRSTCIANPMILPRSSGILLHPTSLPGPSGIGDFGSEARRFVDYLASAGQSVWQVLPLGPTGFGDSPYQCFSALAGNPLLIDLEGLSRSVLTVPDFSRDRVDFERVIPW